MADMMRNYRVGGGYSSRATLANETNPNVRPMPENCQRLKRKLQAIDFAIIETGLYLDAYPECRHALEYYHKLIAERDAVVAIINEKCAPISMRENKSRTEWNWVQGPWPWESDANC